MPSLSNDGDYQSLRFAASKRTIKRISNRCVFFGHVLVEVFHATPFGSLNIRVEFIRGLITSLDNCIADRSRQIRRED